MAEDKVEVVKKSWEDTLPTNTKITVKVNGKIAIVKKGGK